MTLCRMMIANGMRRRRTEIEPAGGSFLAPVKQLKGLTRMWLLRYEHTCMQFRGPWHRLLRSFSHYQSTNKQTKTTTYNFPLSDMMHVPNIHACTRRNFYKLCALVPTSLCYTFLVPLPSIFLVFTRHHSLLSFTSTCPSRFQQLSTSTPPNPPLFLCVFQSP